MTIQLIGPLGIKWKKLSLTFSLVYASLMGQGVVSAKPVSPSAPSAHRAFPYRVKRANTYTFWDKAKQRKMRVVRVYFSSPGYSPIITSFARNKTTSPSSWKLSDEQGHSYIKGSTGIRLASSGKRNTQSSYVLEFTCGYVSIPPEKVGQVRLQFPLNLREITKSKQDGGAVLTVTIAIAIPYPATGILRPVK